MSTHPPREDKRKKRKARAALVVFLKRLQNACKIFKSGDEWVDFVRQLEPLLQEYEQQLPAAHLQRLRNAMQLTDASRAGLKKACRILQSELKEVIRILPAGGTLLPVVIGGLIALAVAVAALYIYIDATAVEVTIINNGCRPIAPVGRLPLPIDLPGVDLPDTAIPAGGSGTARVPRLKVQVDGTQSGTVSLDILGFTLPIGTGSQNPSITFDGVPVSGRRVSVDLGERKRHELVLTCK
jgi:hypothetical protein